MRTVRDATPDVQKAIRELQGALQPFLSRNVDLAGRRITNAGDSIQSGDYVTRYELDGDLKGVDDKIKRLTTEDLPTALNLLGGSVRVGLFAQRGSPISHAQTIFIASDWDYIGWVSNGAAWKYSFGVYRDAVASKPSPTTNDVGLEFVATDTFEVFYWSGSAWVEVLLPLLTQFGGTTSSFPALLRETTGLVARLADDSGDTFLKVLDEAYDATNWDGKTEVPTKNAIRDKFILAISDAAYGAGWDGVVDVAPSKNAVYDQIQTLLGSSAYTITNVTTDRSADANATSLDEVIDVLGTLIADLQAKGILS